MLVLHPNDVAIQLAKSKGTLVISKEYNSRLGVHYWAISDDFGLIETAATWEEAKKLTQGG